jgi:hypothetical protein
MTSSRYEGSRSGHPERAARQLLRVHHGARAALGLLGAPRDLGHPWPPNTPGRFTPSRAAWHGLWHELQVIGDRQTHGEGGPAGSRTR